MGPGNQEYKEENKSKVTDDLTLEVEMILEQRRNQGY